MSRSHVWIGLGSLLRATGLFAAARVLSQLGWFLATLMVARSLGPHGFGKYAVLTAAAGIIVNGLGTGIPVLALREASAGRMSPWLARRLAGCLAATTAAGTCVVAFYGVVMIGGALGALDGVLAGLYFGLVCLVGLGSSLQVGRSRYRQAAIGEALAGMALPVLVGFALLTGSGLVGALVATLLAPLPAVSWLFSRLPTMDAAVIDDRPVFRRSLSFVALGLVSGGYGRADTVVLSLVAGSSTVAFYAAAYRLMGPMQVLLSAFGTIFFSRVSKARSEGRDWMRINRLGQVLLLSVLAPMVIVFMAVAPVVVRVLFGQAFAPAVAPSRLLLLSIIPVALSWPSGHTLNASGRQRTWTLILLGGVCLDAVLVLVMGRYMGADGTATAWLLVESGTAVAVFFAMRKLASEEMWGPVGPCSARNSPS